MIQEILLPKYDQSTEEGTILSWRVQIGDRIEKGQIIFEISTDKADVEVESTVSGVLRQILVGENQTIPVNSVIAIVADADEKIADETLHKVKPAETGEIVPAVSRHMDSVHVRKELSPIMSVPSVTVSEEIPVSLEAGVIKPGHKAASPRAKALADKYGISLLAVNGSGTNGEISECDVKDYYEQVKDIELSSAVKKICQSRNVDLRVFRSLKGQPITEEIAERTPALKGGVPEPLSSMRATIARRLSLSKRVIPHFYLTTMVDMSASIELRKRYNKEISFTDIFIKIAAMTLRKYPRVASVFTPEGCTPRDHINIGFAVALSDDGLVVPVIREPEFLSLHEIAAQTKVLISKAHSKKLTLWDFEGGVFTISNLGMYEVDEFSAIVNPGESAILALSKIHDTPTAIDGQVVVRPLMKMTISCDHRVIDGALAGEFNGAVKASLESPEELERFLRE